MPKVACDFNRSPTGLSIQSKIERFMQELSASKNYFKLTIRESIEITRLKNLQWYIVLRPKMYECIWSVRFRNKALSSSPHLVYFRHFIGIYLWTRMCMSKRRFRESNLHTSCCQKTIIMHKICWKFKILMV